MKKQQPENDTHPVLDYNRTFDDVNACSPMDCTGSVPRPPQTSAELESYLDTYNFLPHSSFERNGGPEIDIVEAEKEGKL